MELNKLKSIYLTLLVSVLASAINANATNYTFTDLSGIGLTGIRARITETYADEINNSGQVVGYTQVGTQPLATVWNNTVASDITATRNLKTEALGINDAGQVVGFSPANYLTTTTRQATSWNGGVANNLVQLNESLVSSTAYAINERGQAVGSSSIAGGPISVTKDGFISVSNAQTKATLWQNGTAIYLDALAGSSGKYGIAHSINNSGQIVGISDTVKSPRHATLWQNGVATDLGTLGGTSSSANAINDLGQIVGYSGTVGNASYSATLWNDGLITDLGTLGGTFSEAKAINALGQIVGTSFNATDNSRTRATLWNNGTIIDINSLLDDSILDAGWVLETATDINDNGWIIGVASNQSLNVFAHGYLLSVSPVPEPQNYALFIAGLGLISLRKLISYKY